MGATRYQAWPLHKKSLEHQLARADYVTRHRHIFKPLVHLWSVLACSNNPGGFSSSSTRDLLNYMYWLVNLASYTVKVHTQLLNYSPPTFKSFLTRCILCPKWSRREVSLFLTYLSASLIESHAHRLNGGLYLKAGGDPFLTFDSFKEKKILKLIFFFLKLLWLR